MSHAEQLRITLAAVEAIPARTDDHAERLRQLEIQQRCVVRLYEPDTPSGQELPRWEAMARALERGNPGLPRVDDIRDAHLPLIGTGRSLNLSPVERAGAWIEHTAAVVRILLANAGTPGAAQKPKRGAPEHGRRSQSDTLSDKQDWAIKLRDSGMTFAKIGAAMRPPISGEAARRLCVRGREVKARRGGSIRAHRTLPVDSRGNVSIVR